MTVARLMVLVLFVATPSALAQDSRFVAGVGSRPVIRPDGTYFFNHVPDSKLVFEGQIAPRILIFDSIADAASQVLSGGTHSGWSLSTTPMVKLRMFREASSPVRTPSYMPKGNVQFARMRNLSRAPASDETARNRGPIEMWLIDAIPFGHHSNGQNGCLFTDQTRNVEGHCVVTNTSRPRAVNKTDGSFSTNYIDAGVYYGRMYVEGTGVPVPTTKREWRTGVGVQFNPKWYLGAAIDDELADLYGQTRVFVEGNMAGRDYSFCGRLEGQVQLHYIHNAPEAIPSVTTIIEGACLPKKWGGTGLFVKFYNGQDYYNLGFAETIRQLQIGFTLQRATFLAFAFSQNP